MSFIVVIPARFASERLPGKPLADIAGSPMIEHVYRRALESLADRVIVATDDERVEACVTGFGGEVVMTRVDHPSGTDRIEEVTRLLDLGDDQIVVNVQGDEPLIPPKVINQVASLLSTSDSYGLSTLCEPLTETSEKMDPNAVKVVFDHVGRALYFSRAPIPWDREAYGKDSVRLETLETLPATHSYRHIGLYAYRTSFLKNFVAWKPSPLEQLEKLEQLRAMENGVPIRVAVANESPPSGVDTPEDLEKVRARIASRR